MARDWAVSALETFASLYARRLMMGPLASVFTDTKLGARARDLAPLQRRAVEAGLYGLTSILDKRLASDPSDRGFLRDVLIDLSSEVGRNIVEAPNPEGRADESLAAVFRRDARRAVVDALLAMESDDLDHLCAEFEHADAVGKDSLQKVIGTLSAEQLKQMLNLTPAQRGIVFELSGYQKESSLRVLNRYLRKWLGDPEAGDA